MKELQQRQRMRRIIYSIPTLLILALFAAFMTKGAVGVIQKDRESSSMLSELQDKAAALVSREGELKAGIADLHTEKGIKDEIRERFGMIQDGEHIAIIVDEKNSATSSNDSLLPWYQKVWHVIINFK